MSLEENKKTIMQVFLMKNALYFIGQSFYQYQYWTSLDLKINFISKKIY